MRTIFITVFFLLNYSFLKSQNVGIGNIDPKAKLDISGDLILKSADLTLADGNTLNLDVNTNKYNHYKLIGPTGNFQIGGIAAAEHDRIITLYNRSGHSLEVYNDDVNASPSNRILTGTGGTFAVYPGGSLTLKYDNTINKWEITASHYNSLDNFGSGNWSLSGNDIYNSNVGNVGINTTTPLTSLQVNGNLSLVSDTVIAPCSAMLPLSMNNDILIDNTVKKKSIFHIIKETSCSTGISPEFMGLKGGTDGQMVTIFTHLNNTQIKHLQGLTFNPTALDSTYMIELFEPNGNGNLNEPNYLTLNSGGSITLIYDSNRNKWKPVNYYGDYKSDLSAWFKGPNPNDIYNPNSGNVGIGTGLPSEKLEVYGNIEVSGEIKPNGQSGQAGEILQSNGNGTMAWMQSSSTNSSVGFGSWGCEMDNLAAFNPVFPSDGQPVDGFGSSADLKGNFAIIGAKDATIGGNVKQGCAYIFHYDGQNWVEMQKLTANDGIANDEFGNSVAIFGNWAIVAASKADFNGNMNRGAVYMYQYNGNSWVEHQKIIDTNGQNNHEFGYDVCISASHVVISTIGTNNFTGAAHTFIFDGNLWILQQTITANDGNAQDWFGFSTSLYEDRLIISAALDSDQGFAAGSVYFFHLINNVWTFQSKIYDISPVLSGGYGTSVSLANNNAIIGDFNNNIHFVKFENGQWVSKTKLNVPQLSTVSISNEYAIASTGVILKSTVNHWFHYEKANDPQSTSGGAVFKTVAIDQERFVMCAPTALANMGMAIFGSIK